MTDIREQEMQGKIDELTAQKASLEANKQLRKLDYLESAEFFPNYSQEEKLLAYGNPGGIPRYLKAFNPAQDIATNIADRSI